MIRMFVSVCLLHAAIAGCSQTPTSSAVREQTDDRRTGWPEGFEEHIGQIVTLEGTAADAKLGALLVGDGNSIWIDGLESWPEGFYRGGDNSKRLRVTGKIIKRDDMPVFIQKPGEKASAGIPVKNEQELEQGKWRFLLKDAKWTVIE
jgi:hypothetical protein